MAKRSLQNDSIGIRIWHIPSPLKTPLILTGIGVDSQMAAGKVVATGRVNLQVLVGA